MSTYPHMVKVEAGDEICLPLTSVPMYIRESGQNNASQRAGDLELR